MSETTRRAVLTGAAGVSAATVLAACGDDIDDPTGTPPAGNTTTGGTTGQAEALGSVSEVPVGGGKVFAAQSVVVTQPTAGQFKCFSAMCTHAGCKVSSVENGTIKCPCHGSGFKIQDGSVANGPATAPLPSRTVRVDGDKLVLG